MGPTVIFCLWYWNEMQKDDRFTSVYSRPLEEWRILGKLKRILLGIPLEKEEWEKNELPAPK